MDVPKNSSAAAAASSSSTGRVEEESTDHSKQINKLISTYFTPPKLKPNISIPKRPVSRFKPNSSTTTTNAVEKSKKKKNKNNAGAVSEKNSHRVWTDADEILLLKAMADYVKRGENPNSLAFYEFIQTRISVDVNFEQIRNKINKARQRYEAKEEEEKKRKVLKFTTPHLQECHELSKPIWGSGGEPEDGGDGVEGSETVGVQNEDYLEIRKSKRDKKKKPDESKKPGNEHSERKDGAAEEPEEEDVQFHAVAEKEEEDEAENVQVHAVVDKQKGVEAENVHVNPVPEKERGVEAENVHVNAVAEKEKGVEAEHVHVNADADKEKEVEAEDVHVNADAEKEKEVEAENVHVHAVAEKQKQVEGGETKEKNKKKKKKKKKAEEDVQVHADAEKQREVEAGEIKEKNKKKKRKAEENVQVHAVVEKEKEVEAENVHVHADAEKQKKVEGGETKERNKKKKKKRQTGGAAAESVSENLIIEQLAKAPWGLEGFPNEETKKAIQSIDPSKVVALEEKWKQLQVQETQVFLKRAILDHEFASMISGASVRSPTS